jgi:hypothetical protein
MAAQKILQKAISTAVVISQVLQLSGAFQVPGPASPNRPPVPPVPVQVPGKPLATALPNTVVPQEVQVLMPETPAARNDLSSEGERVSALIHAEAGGVVVLGDAEIEIPAGALYEDTEISITRLHRTEDTGETLRNVTEGGGGYRFLPAGLEFKATVYVKLPYEAGLEARDGGLEDATGYFFNTDTSAWEALERVGAETERRRLISGTTHFTDMINGTLTLPEGPKPLSFDINSIKGLEAADPNAGIIPLRGLEADHTGAGRFSFELEVPPGRAGMTPRIAVSYSSDGGNGILGRGFSLEAGGEVGHDTRRGLPEYGAGREPENRYLLDGVMLELAGKDGNVYRYEERKHGEYRRIRHYTEYGAGAGNGDYWEVTDRRGTVRLYGRNGSWTGTEAGAKYRWLLERETDRFGNRVRYEYNTV